MTLSPGFIDQLNLSVGEVRVANAEGEAGDR